MFDHVLDRPIWTTLTTTHAALAQGGANARRYPSDVSPFIAMRDDSDGSMAEMATLVPEEGFCVMLQSAPSPVPAGIAVEQTGAVQMVASDLKPAPWSAEVIPLGDADAPDMLELATMTKPGPFLANTHRLGGFIGIRSEGHLVAMAGERLHPGAWCEVSGVCTHPDFRGRGYAGMLTLMVANRIAERGETPFLHTYASNTTAIRLYEKLGFVHRSDMTVQILTRA